MEEKLFEVKEYYTRKRYLDYCKYAYWKKENRFLKIIWVLYLLFCGYEIVNGIVNGFGWGNIALFVLFFLIGLYMLCFSYQVRARRAMKASRDFFAERRITFYEDRFETETQKGAKSSPYKGIKKIYETADGFYLILNSNALLMVFKDCLTLGTAEELSVFLRGRLGESAG